MHIRGRVPNLETPEEEAQIQSDEVRIYQSSCSVRQAPGYCIQEGFTRASTVEEAQTKKFGV